jgi:hypothetical protein
MRLKISNSKVENVVYAPKKPTVKNNRRFSLISIFSVAGVSRKPMRKEPVMLMKKVGNGKETKMEAKNELLTA